MERLFLVRHAETLVTGPRVLRGAQSSSDVLSEHGHRQAALCGTAFASLHLIRPAVYASTFFRAQQTAGPLAAALGVGVTILEELQEMDPGNWYGRPYHDLKTHSRELFRRSGDFGFPGGERSAEVRHRLRQALKQTLNQGRTPVLVSHGLAPFRSCCVTFWEPISPWPGLMDVTPMPTAPFLNFVAQTGSGRRYACVVHNT